MTYIQTDRVYMMGVKYPKEVCDFLENCSNVFYIDGEVFFQPAQHLYKKTDKPNVYDVYANKATVNKKETVQRATPRVGDMVFAWNKEEPEKYIYAKLARKREDRSNGKVFYDVIFIPISSTYSVVLCFTCCSLEKPIP